MNIYCNFDPLKFPLISCCCHLNYLSLLLLWNSLVISALFMWLLLDLYLGCIYLLILGVTKEQQKKIKTLSIAQLAVFFLFHIMDYIFHNEFVINLPLWLLLFFLSFESLQATRADVTISKWYKKFEMAGIIWALSLLTLVRIYGICRQS